MTLVIAAGMALAAWAGRDWAAGGGVAAGGALAYLNFMWMRASLRALVATTTAAGGRPARLQMAKFFLRWVAIGAAIWLAAQLASTMAVAIVCGLFALPLAVAVEAFVQAWHGARRPSAA